MAGSHSHRWRAAAIALAAAIGACVGSGGAVVPGDPGSAPTGDFPAFPAGEAPPSAAEVARLLASGVPERDRAAATRLLVDDILPWDLRDLPAAPRGELTPRAIVRAAYGTLAAQLGSAAPDRRLRRLATLACHRRGLRVTERATALAVARFVADRGRPRTNLVVGYLDEARPYLAMTIDEHGAEADRLDAELTSFEQAARADPACYERERTAIAQARHTLGAVRSGQYEVATGAFYVFLRHAGANPRHGDPQ